MAVLLQLSLFRIVHFYAVGLDKSDSYFFSDNPTIIIRIIKMEKTKKKLGITLPDTV